MFNKEDEKNRILVEISMSDSQKLKGNLLIPMISTLSRTLNNDSQFLDFEDFEGCHHMIAKTAICDVKSTAMPKSIDLDAKAKKHQDDPYRVLGVDTNATAEEIRGAYDELTKLYNPDKFAGLELPKELSQYLDQSICRINTAYNFLDDKELKPAA